MPFWCAVSIILRRAAGTKTCCHSGDDKARFNQKEDDGVVDDDGVDDDVEGDCVVVDGWDKALKDVRLRHRTVRLRKDTEQ
jgi:hypothetical protein